MSSDATTGLELRADMNARGQLRLSLQKVSVPEPGPDEVLVRMEASPLNPADIGFMLGLADPATATADDDATGPAVVLDVPESGKAVMARRAGESLKLGNEGAGTVIKAGANARDLVGKVVAIRGGAMHATHRIIAKSECLVLRDGDTARDGASSFINPLTALTMVEVMKLEGHTALIHSVGASNLGQMLIKICQEDGIELVNIVRSEQQARMLRDLGAKHVCNSSLPGFRDDLIEACAATGATLAFDAIGGKMSGTLLSCMEAALVRKLEGYSRYGTFTHKQVYNYGTLDMSPIEITRDIGMAWGVGGFLFAGRLAKMGPEVAKRLSDRVVNSLKTTFASHYSNEISLAEALQPDVLKAYARKATGEKYLVTPQKGL